MRHRRATWSERQSSSRRKNGFARQSSTRPKNGYCGSLNPGVDGCPGATSVFTSASSSSDHAVPMRADVVLPLLQRARTRDHGGDDAVRPQPRQRELRQRAARLRRVDAQRLRDLIGFLPQFGFHHPPVAARSPRSFGDRSPGQVLAGEDAARDRRVRRDAKAIVVACRQDLHFGDPVEQVVIGLAHHRRRHSLRFALVDDFRDAPAAEIRHAEIADLAGADQAADRVDGLGQRRVGVVAVQVVDVDVVGAKARAGCRRRRRGSSAAKARRRGACRSSRWRPWWPGSSAGAPRRSPGRRRVPSRPSNRRRRCR